jgi:hypothetical protein
MSLRGALATDEGIRDLDRVLAAAHSSDSNFEDNFIELSLFFLRHLRTGLLPVLPSTVFPSAIQKQVYTFLGKRWNRFIALIESTQLPDSLIDSVVSLFLADVSRSLTSVIVSLFIDNRILQAEVLGCEAFQEAVYTRLIESGVENREIALKVLTVAFPESQPSESFRELFVRFTECDVIDSEIGKLLEGFDGVLARVDDRLVTYDFLYRALERGWILALPFLVSVSVERAVDVSEVYEFAFRGLTVGSVGCRSRIRVFETLSKILASSKLPSSITTAFAVKLSRFLPLVPPDAQLDVLGLLQVLVRAHGAVAELLTVARGAVSNVEGGIDECRPQTLWEAKAMQNSPVPAIADTARKLGAFHLPPDFGSFDLKAAVEACKTKPSQSSTSGNWIEGLDQAGWGFP